MTKSRKAIVRKLCRQRQKLLDELPSLAGMIKGSLFERFSTCSRPNCACHEGKRHGPRCYLSITEGLTQRQRYVRKRDVAAVRTGVQQYHRTLEIAQRITAINIELMREGAHDEPDT